MGFCPYHARLCQALPFVSTAILMCRWQGATPDLQDAMAIRNAIVATSDLRQPVDLGHQLLNRGGLSEDVGRSLITMLQACSLGRLRQRKQSTQAYLASA